MAMINQGIYLPRRTILRGLGATIALPLLDCMVPAFAHSAKTAAKPVRRLGVIYAPNGKNMLSWTPATEGAGFEFTPTLKPLEPFRDRLLVLSGLCNKEADGVAGDGSGDHTRSQSGFLTGVRPRKTEGSDIYNGISMDQIVAKELGRATQLPSFELALESNELAGIGEQGYSAAYTGTIAWSSATTPVPMLADPRAGFERLFGVSESTERAARLARMRLDRSILDSVGEEVTGLMRKLGAGDQRKIDEYFESVRGIERRIQIAEEQIDKELPSISRPAGAPDSFMEYGRLMFDLMVLAYQADLTRVATFLIGREKSSRTFPEFGVPEPHHPVSHHQNRADLLEKKHKIDRVHTQLFAYFLERLQSMPDGDGTLLDNVVVLYGCGMSDSDGHIHHDLPILLAGGGAGSIKGGRHIRFGRTHEDETPLMNLHLTLLDKMGIPAEQFGDSTGKVSLLSDV
jgi:hypothetical protein